MERADTLQRDFVDWRSEGHGGGDWTESSRTLQVKGITSERRNSCLFFQRLLLFFRESPLFFSPSAPSLPDLRTDKGGEGGGEEGDRKRVSEQRQREGGRVGG